MVLLFISYFLVFRQVSPIHLENTIFSCLDCLDYYDDCNPICETECKTTLLFLDDKNALRQDQCWSDYSYRKATYIIQNQSLILNYALSSVDYSPSEMSGQVLQTHTEQPFSETYQIENCNGQLSLQLRNSSYNMYCSTLRNISKDSLQIFKNELKTKGILEKLGM